MKGGEHLVLVDVPDALHHLTRVLGQDRLGEGAEGAEERGDGAAWAELHEDVKRPLHLVRRDVLYNMPVLQLAQQLHFIADLLHVGV